MLYQEYRVVLCSDLHCTHVSPMYDLDYRDRMRLWVETIKREHAEYPIDLLLILGDISLDYWSVRDLGTFLAEGHSSSCEFVRDYLSEVPTEIPVLMIPGNHEPYSAENWKKYTGFDRSGHFALGKNLFILLDNYAGNLDPKTQEDGVYSVTRVEEIERLMAQYPEHDVYLCAHYFDVDNETESFRALLREHNRIKCLFAGHTHVSSVIKLGAEWGNKAICQTGHYSNSADRTNSLADFWGFRELLIKDRGASTKYVTAENHVTLDGRYFDIERREIYGLELK